MLLNAARLHPFNGRTPEQSRLQMMHHQAGRPSPRVPDTENASLSEEKETMLNFILHNSDTENCGGFLWTWKRIWNGELFADEGVWIQSRLYVIQAAQLVIALIMGFFFFIIIPLVANLAEESREDLKDFPNLPAWVLNIVPTRQQVYGAFYPASIIALLVAISILKVYIPSTVTTILRLRSGALPSLHDPLFFKYRKSPETVYVNVGNAIYAMLGAGVLFFLIVAGFIFLIIWPFTRGLVKLIAAWGLGLLITIVVKTALVMLCRSKFYVAFCRTRPLGANITTLTVSETFPNAGICSRSN
jgi:hypothetical protein